MRFAYHFACVLMTEKALLRRSRGHTTLAESRRDRVVILRKSDRYSIIGLVRRIGKHINTALSTQQTGRRSLLASSRFARQKRERAGASNIYDIYFPLSCSLYLLSHSLSLLYPLIFTTSLSLVLSIAILSCLSYLRCEAL